MSLAAGLVRSALGLLDDAGGLRSVAGGVGRRLVVVALGVARAAQHPLEPTGEARPNPDGDETVSGLSRRLNFSVGWKKPLLLPSLSRRFDANRTEIREDYRGRHS